MPEGPRPRLDTFRAPLAAALEEGVYLIKPIRGEPGALVGSRLDDEIDCLTAAKRRVDDGGTEIVALSLGHAGAMLVTTFGCRTFRGRGQTISHS